MAALWLDVPAYKQTPEKQLARRIYGENLNQNTKLIDRDPEILERTINNLKRLNLSVDHPEVKDILFENLKIKDDSSPQQQDPNTWNLKELTLQ